MSQVERVGVSLEKELLAPFDVLVRKRGYPSRSEAIRDLIRQQISEDRLSNPKATAVAAVFLVYNHHSTRLMGRPHHPSNPPRSLNLAVRGNAGYLWIAPIKKGRTPVRPPSEYPRSPVTSTDHGWTGLSIRQLPSLLRSPLP